MEGYTMQHRLTIAITGLLIALMAAPIAAQESFSPVDTKTPVDALTVTATDAQREQILFLLSGYEYFPSADELTKVTPNAHAVLFQLATDESALPSHRLRAIDALGLLPRNGALARIFEEKLSDTTTSPLLTRHYINASMKAFGEDALVWVAPHLNHIDLQTQLTVIHAIGLFGGVGGRQLLEFQAQFSF